MFSNKTEVDLKGREIYFSAFFLSIIQFVTETANLKITLTFAVLKIINYNSQGFFLSEQVLFFLKYESLFKKEKKKEKKIKTENSFYK